MTVINESWKIRGYQYRVWISALKLEAKGLRHSGGAIRPRIAERVGLKPSAKRELFIAAIEKMILNETNIQEQFDFDQMVERRGEEIDYHNRANDHD